MKPPPRTDPPKSKHPPLRPPKIPKVPQPTRAPYYRPKPTPPMRRDAPNPTDIERR